MSIPATMRALQQTSLNGPQDLRLITDAPVPAPEPGEVLIRVITAWGKKPDPPGGASKNTLQLGFWRRQATAPHGSAGAALLVLRKTTTGGTLVPQPGPAGSRPARRGRLPAWRTQDLN
jgi:hypothetical protein